MINVWIDGSLNGGSLNDGSFVGGSFDGRLLTRILCCNLRRVHLVIVFFFSAISRVTASKAAPSS